MAFHDVLLSPTGPAGGEGKQHGDTSASKAERFRVRPDNAMAIPRALGLDSWSWSEGLLKVMPTALAGFMLLLLGALCLIYQGTALDVVNIDWRDMLYDYRRSLAGMQSAHAGVITQFLALDLTSALTLGGLPVALTLQGFTLSTGNVNVTEFRGALGSVVTLTLASTSCPDTGPTNATYAAGAGLVSFPPYDPGAVPPQVVAVTFASRVGNGTSAASGATAAPVALYRPTGSLDAGPVAIARLSSLTVRVTYSTLRDPCCVWALVSADGGYTTVAGTAAGGTGAVAVTVHDVGAPAALSLPTYDGRRGVVGVTLLAAGGLLLCAWVPFLLSAVHYTIRTNHRLPPFCWRSRTDFRGW